jgi:hypothetical protein
MILRIVQTLVIGMFQMGWEAILGFRQCDHRPRKIVNLDLSDVGKELPNSIVICVNKLILPHSETRLSPREFPKYWRSNLVVRFELKLRFSRVAFGEDSPN